MSSPTLLAKQTNKKKLRLKIINVINLQLQIRIRN